MVVFDCANKHTCYGTYISLTVGLADSMCDSIRFIINCQIRFQIRFEFKTFLRDKLMPVSMVNKWMSIIPLDGFAVRLKKRPIGLPKINTIFLDYCEIETHLISQ